MADITLKIDTETAKAIRDLVRFAQAQDTAADATKRGNRAAQEHTKRLEQLGKGAGDAGGTFGLLQASAGKALAAMGGFAAIIGIVTKLEDHLNAVAEKNKAIARSMIPLAQLYGSGNLDREMLTTGAHYGMVPMDSAALGVTIPAGLGATKKDFAIGAQLAQMGVAPDRAGDVLVAGISRGVGSQRAGDLTLVGAGESKLTANEFARSIPASAQFSRMEEGLAAAAAISLSGVQAERIPELTKAAAKVLANDNGDFVKKFKSLKGKTESDKIVELRRLADASGDVGKFASISNLTGQVKGLDELSAEAIGMLIRNSGAYEATEQKLTAVKSGELQRTIARIRKQRPEIAKQWDDQQASAELAVNQYIGKEGDKASDWALRNKARGLLIKRTHPGLAPLLTDDEGRANALGRFYATLSPNLLDYEPVAEGDWLSKKKRKEVRLPEQVRSGQEALQAETRYLSKANDDVVSERTARHLVSALDANTAATASNTAATSADKSSGGDHAGGGGYEHSAPYPPAMPGRTSIIETH